VHELLMERGERVRLWDRQRRRLLGLVLRQPELTRTEKEFRC
jgi:hypothetical protein